MLLPEASGSPSTSTAIACMLAGAARECPPPLSLDLSQLETAAPLLLQSGAGALCWWRIRNTELASTDCGHEFRQAYRLHSIQSALHEREIRRSFAELRSHGIEPILVKGWAVARLYPDSGLRPYDDIDLIVTDEQVSKAVAILEARVDKYGLVDVHRASQLDRESFECLLERSQIAMLGDAEIRVLSPEDHLRVLCIHLLKHGAFRPLWLCDIAMAVENRPQDFDWRVCLGADSKRAKWVSCAIGIAHQLLGAKIDDTPAARLAKDLPSWLIPCVLKQWEKPRGIDHAPDELISVSLRRPWSIHRAVFKRWRDPIRATICVEGSFGAMPRFFYQLEDYIAQLAKFLVRLPQLLRSQQET